VGGPASLTCGRPGIHAISTHDLAHGHDERLPHRAPTGAAIHLGPGPQRTPGRASNVPHTRSRHHGGMGCGQRGDGPQLSWKNQEENVVGSVIWF
jgi:hypothetical protein